MASSSSNSLPVTAQTLFCPNIFQRQLMRTFAGHKIPRYLFRLVAPETAGDMTTSTVTPPAWMWARINSPEDIFRRDPEDAASLLYSHLKWECDDDCNLMSWTSSLLLALQYGFYRHVKDSNEPRLNEISLFILDTRGFPEGTIIKDTDAMKALKGYSTDIKDFLEFRLNKSGKSKRYYFGEYLTQGQLDIQGKCVSVSLQRIIDLGLFELYPELGDRSKWNIWAKRVIKLREIFAHPCLTTHSEVRRALTIAQGCFRDCWVVPFAASLLALKSRKQDDTKIVEAFSAMFAAEEIAELSLQNIQIDYDSLPEVEQFARLIGSIYRRFYDKDISLLLNPFTKLEITDCLR
ncbi:uncharacterized protein BDW43DRAFT_321241 [Aspergillus alliaceus]|uniref:uncharacterized protein n=1 Tax=Petromyces alliaceus TaxID=209559 RepID=UPI0012A5768B|nr:uncharacterized protein BDW43DRAFT_321241 [Aspergillus alliaceus]KAB8238172.1 hypothetical protein BDW43DRAFT_321241 [Aspergillus alliaceus]